MENLEIRRKHKRAIPIETDSVLANHFEQKYLRKGIQLCNEDINYLEYIFLQRTHFSSVSNIELLGKWV